MFKSLLIVLTPLVLLSSCQQKTAIDCSKVHYGVFHRTISPGRERVKIERDNFSQNEFYPDSSLNRIYWINWKNNCECELIELTRKDTASPVTLSLPLKRRPEGVSYIHRIKQIEQDYYLFDFFQDGNKEVVSDTMWIDHLIGGFKTLEGTYKEQ
ncbi:MAG: hypothetical protein NTW29_03345 [Bacteroidetes bacterium]|nr:hypothetical protein [Bacteroidota bacterium]